MAARMKHQSSDSLMRGVHKGSRWQKQRGLSRRQSQCGSGRVVAAEAALVLAEGRLAAGTSRAMEGAFAVGDG